MATRAPMQEGQQAPRYYEVRPGRALHWPRRIATRNRLWARAGWVVDLGDPFLRRMAASQMLNKLKPLDALPAGRKVIGLEQCPRTVKQAASEWKRTKPPAPQGIALAGVLGSADLPGLELPHEAKMSTEQRKALEQQRQRKMDELHDSFRVDLSDRIVKSLDPATISALIDKLDAQSDDPESAALSMALAERVVPDEKPKKGD